jgi:hypothetical protein
MRASFGVGGALPPVRSRPISIQFIANALTAIMLHGSEKGSYGTDDVVQYDKKKECF